MNASALLDNIFVALISGVVSPFLCIWLYAVLPFWIGDLVTALRWRTLEDPEEDQRVRSRVSDRVSAKVEFLLGGHDGVGYFFQVMLFNSLFCLILTPVAFGVLLLLDQVVWVDPPVKLLITPWAILLGVIVANHVTKT